MGGGEFGDLCRVFALEWFQCYIGEIAGLHGGMSDWTAFYGSIGHGTKCAIMNIDCDITSKTRTLSNKELQEGVLELYNEAWALNLFQCEPPNPNDPFRFERRRLLVVSRISSQRLLCSISWLWRAILVASRATDRCSVSGLVHAGCVVAVLVVGCRVVIVLHELLDLPVVEPLSH